jgi:hypothetical protein
MIDLLMRFIITRNQSYKNQLTYPLLGLNIPSEENAFEETKMIIGKGEKG